LDQAQDPIVQFALPISKVNFILQSLDKNPLGASVAAVSQLMVEIQEQAANRPVPPAPAPASLQQQVGTAVEAKAAGGPKRQR
jgi:hypothetical protein